MNALQWGTRQKKRDNSLHGVGFNPKPRPQSGCLKTWEFSRASSRKTSGTSQSSLLFSKRGRDCIRKLLDFNMSVEKPARQQINR